EAAVGRPQLLAWAGPHAAVFGRAVREIRRRDFLLPERGPAESAFAHGLRSGAGGHGALPRRVRAERAFEYRRRLLRQHARAHGGERACVAPSAATSGGAGILPAGPRILRDPAERRCACERTSDVR